MGGTVREPFAVEFKKENNLAEKLAVLSTAHFACRAAYDRGVVDSYSESMDMSYKYVENAKFAHFDDRRDLNFMEVFSGDAQGYPHMKAEEFLKDEIGFLKDAKPPIGVAVETVEEAELAIKAMWNMFHKGTPKVLQRQMKTVSTAVKCDTHALCIIEFEEDMFPWVTVFDEWDDLKHSKEEMPIVLASTLIEYAKVSKTEPAAPSRYKNGDVVLVRTASHNVVMAFVVNQIKGGWYLAKDIFTSKCMLVTENKVEGANVIQGASP